MNKINVSAIGIFLMVFVTIIIWLVPESGKYLIGGEGRLWQANSYEEKDGCLEFNDTSGSHVKICSKEYFIQER